MKRCRPWQHLFSVSDLPGSAPFHSISHRGFPAQRHGAERARQAARGLLLEHPDINVLVGFNEPLAVGTAMAVDELELNGQVREIAFDTNPVCVELLQKGAVSALIVQNPYAMGYLGVETAWRSLQGERFDASSLINTPTTTITRETMFTIESQKAIFSFD